jgi:hypothetical protein
MTGADNVSCRYTNKQPTCTVSMHTRSVVLDDKIATCQRVQQGTAGMETLMVWPRSLLV